MPQRRSRRSVNLLLITAEFIQPNRGLKFRNNGRDKLSFRVSDIDMKGNVLLVTSCGTDLVSTVDKAARKTGRSLRQADSCRQTFEILSLGLEDVEVAIVDMDASLHSLAILEALNYSDTAPPVIALIEVDEADATPIVQRHGAVACLKKPFGADELATLIENVCASACRNKVLTCDKWGHVRTPNVRSSQRKLIPNMVASSP